MINLTRYISNQFGNPHGFVGSVITFLQNVINNAMYKSVVSNVKASSSDRILDVGYGNGHLLELVYSKTGADLYGIDISDDARAMAEKRNKKAMANNQLHLEVGDCCDLPYEDEFFSAVTSINTIYFWSDTTKGLSEIRRTLKPGKSFYNVVYTKEYLDKVKYTKYGYKKFETQELIDYGYKAGFSKCEVKDIVKGDSLVVVYTK